MRIIKHLRVGFASVLFVVSIVGLVICPRSQGEDLKNDRQFKNLHEALFSPCGPGTHEQRFVVSEDGDSVCDNTTGLWWEQSPGTTTFDWQVATDHCANLTLSEKTWRLPKAKELGTLVELRVPNKVAVLNMPKGPFQNVQEGPYWSATTVAGNSSNAWMVEFDIGAVESTHKALLFFAWCVSGGQNAH